MAEVSKPTRSCAACFFIDSDTTGTSNFFGYYDSWKRKWYDQEYIDAFIYGAQGKDYPLSTDFIKKNEVKVESIVGKNLLKEPVTLKDWNPYIINGNIFVRSTPAKYKIEFQIEKNGSRPILSFSFNNINWQFQEVVKKQNVRVTGGTKEGNNIIVKSDVVTISIDEELSKEIESANDVGINGQDIIIKSMKVVE